VRFLKKGLGKATARFDINSATVAEIWNDPSSMQERKFLVQVRNEHGEVITEIVKYIHIRRKTASAP
jgi:hypothetical protein